MYVCELVPRASTEGRGPSITRFSAASSVLHFLSSLLSTLRLDALDLEVRE